MRIVPRIVHFEEAEHGPAAVLFILVLTNVVLTTVRAGGGRAYAVCVSDF